MAYKSNTGTVEQSCKDYNSEIFCMMRIQIIILWKTIFFFTSSFPSDASLCCLFFVFSALLSLLVLIMNLIHLTNLLPQSLSCFLSPYLFYLSTFRTKSSPLLFPFQGCLLFSSQIRWYRRILLSYHEKMRPKNDGNAI